MMHVRSTALASTRVSERGVREKVEALGGREVQQCEAKEKGRCRRLFNQFDVRQHVRFLPACAFGMDAPRMTMGGKGMCLKKGQ